MGVVARSIREIASDLALTYYGACLAALNVLTALFWLTVEPIERILSPSESPVCWPFVPGCGDLRILSPTAIRIAIVGVLAAAALNVALFLGRRHIRLAYWFLLVITATKTFLILQDYRLIHNEHYMAGWVTAVFLFMPFKRRSLKVLVVAFYVWAGLLKFDADWLSGAALYGRQPLGLPAQWIPAECIYVIFLELVVSWGVLCKSGRLFWPALCQLLLFHVASWWVVGYFYPLLMASILAIYILDRAIAPDEPVSAAGRLDAGAITASCLMLAFAGFQLVPRLYPGSPALTGEGRMFALHMFDAPTVCRGFRVTQLQSGASRKIRIWPRFIYPRIACDPIVFVELAFDVCRDSERYREHQDDFDLLLEIKRSNWKDYLTLVSISKFCESGASYKVIGHNSWIRPLS